MVIAYLRDICGGRGELVSNSGISYIYDREGKFDSGSAGFLLGKRRVFDLIIRYISLDEQTLFSLVSEEEKNQRIEDRTLNILQG